MNKFKIIAIVALLSLLLPTTAKAYDFMVDGLYYDINTEGTSVSVTYEQEPSSSNNYTSYTSLSDTIIIPDTIAYDGTNYPVTAIGDRTFQNCKNITVVNIPNSVISIGVGAFSSCKGLTSITIPYSLKSIDDGAFYGCTGLTSVTWNAKNCKFLYDIDYEHEAIFPFAGSNNITSFVFGNEVSSIPDYLCYALKGLTSVEFPNSLTSIGRYAFSCTGLTSVTIPNSVYSVYESAFASCSSLTSVTWNARSCTHLYDSYKEIADSPFVGSRNLNSFVFGEEVIDIPSFLCAQLGGINSIIVPNSVKRIGMGAFYSSGIKSIVIGNSVTTIYEGAFFSCALNSVVWNAKSCRYSYYDPYNFYTIFSGSSSIKSFVFGGEVVSIPDYACYHLKSLTSINIPKSVKSIGKEAFSGCTGLSRIEAYPDPNNVTLGSLVFARVPKENTLHVPSKYLEAYTNATQWSDFTSIKGDLSDAMKTNGDVNGDEVIDIMDVTALINFILGDIPDDFVLENANIDQDPDGYINIQDVTILINMILQ